MGSSVFIMVWSNDIWSNSWKFTFLVTENKKSVFVCMHNLWKLSTKNILQTYSQKFSEDLKISKNFNFCQQKSKNLMRFFIILKLKNTIFPNFWGKILYFQNFREKLWTSELSRKKFCVLKFSRKKFDVFNIFQKNFDILTIFIEIFKKFLTVQHIFVTYACDLSKFAKLNACSDGICGQICLLKDCTVTCWLVGTSKNFETMSMMFDAKLHMVSKFFAFSQILIWFFWEF